MIPVSRPAGSTSGVDWTPRNRDAAAISRWGRERRVLVDVEDHHRRVEDHHRRTPTRRPAAGGDVVIDDGEVFEKLAVEPGLGGDPQSAVPEFAELDIAGASLGQRDRSLERTLEQRADVR